MITSIGYLIRQEEEERDRYKDAVWKLRSWFKIADKHATSSYNEKMTRLILMAILSTERSKKESGRNARFDSAKASSRL